MEFQGNIAYILPEINMTLEDIENMWAQDCKINLLNLEQSSADTYELHSKYSKIWNAAKLHLSKLENEKNRLTLIKNDYYTGNLDHQTMKENKWKPYARTVLKAELPTYVAADNDIIELNLRIATFNQIVSFVESILRTVQNRQFHIKNIIDNRKFVNGGY